MTNSEFGRTLTIRARPLASAFMLAAAATAVSAQAIQSADTPRGEEFAPTPPYIERIARDRPIARMSVRDVVEQTVRANLDLVLERYNQLLARQRLVATEGFYDPNVTLASSLGQATNPLTASPGDIRVPGETIQTSGFGPTIRQNVLGGGVVTAGVTNSYSQTSSLAPTVNPSFSSVFNASVTQPLLRGFVRTATDRQVRNGRLDITISDLLYRQKVTQVLQQVLNQYWELVFANESYEARRQSRNLAVTQPSWRRSR